ncbi:hypothetical protein EBZ39_03325 [bacterium]|nr:hypothetical protein [bacterium]
MKFSKWLIERNQKDATKMPERKTGFELFQKAARKNMHSMKHGRAGIIDTDKHKGSRGGKNRSAIDRSSRGD